MPKRVITYLSVIVAIFARDVKRIARNPVALIVVLGMMLIPSAYAWYVIAANWDPYNNTENMLVAVANEDTGYESDETGKLDVGDQVIANLKDNHEMGWVFTDEESAVNGVYEGRYWAALVIPADFSKDFASVLSGQFTRPTLDYYVNEKPSSIAPKVTNAAAEAVERSINENFVETVAEKIVTVTQKAGAHTEDESAAADDQLTHGIRSAHTTVQDAQRAIDGLADTVSSTQKAAKEANSSLEHLQEEIPHLQKALGETRTLLDKTRDTVNQYGTSLSEKASAGALQLSAAAAQAERMIGTVSGDVASAHQEAQTALDQANELLADNQTLIAQLQDEANQDGANPALSQALAAARETNERISATVQAATEVESALAATADALETEGTAIDTAAEKAASATTQVTSTFQSSILPAITASLDDLADACGTLNGVLAGLDPSLSQARTILNELDDTLESSRSSLGATASSLDTMEQSLNDTLTDLEALQNSATAKALADYLKADPEAIGQFMAAPVQLETQLVYPVKNYGSGVAPFFTNLALWVAGFILMAIVKMRVDPTGLPRFTATQAYFGRWLLYIVIALIQGLICCAGDLVLGIQCENPAAFVSAGLLTVFVDVNLMYALAYACRHIGKALAVILLILQIPGSSGMFPIEMMPAFFQFIHPFLPFTYSIDAMREAIGGFYGLDYLWDMLRLGLIFVPLGLLIGVGIGRADFNVNLMFDKKLAATDLLLAEPVTSAAEAAAKPMRFRTRTLMQALLDTDSFRAKLIARAERFRRRYPHLRRLGWVALFAQPIITFAVMVLVQADVDTRVEMLMAMVAGIIAVDVYLIVISFISTSLAHQLALADLSAEEVQKQARTQERGRR